MRLISGQMVEVDDADTEALYGYTWHVADGYVRRSVRGQKCVRLHRQLLNAADGEIVDHADGNPLNNRRDNIRLCSWTENARNRRKMHRGQLPKGVERIESGRYRARICVGRRLLPLGVFDTVEIAAQAYMAAARRIFGKFATERI